MRVTEAAGYAPGLWKRLVGMGAVSMALPAEAGGDGSSLVDLTLVAEEVGFGDGAGAVDRACGDVASAGAGGRRVELLADALAADRVFMLALAPVRGGARAAGAGGVDFG